MLGGGSFKTQNKVLPGSYINFVSAGKNKWGVSDRGVAAVPFILDWGVEQSIFEVTAEQFYNQCETLFGYTVEAPQMLPLRELFTNLKKGIFYRLNKGVASTCTYASARYGGVRGNQLMIVISTNVDDSDLFDVKTLLDGKEVDRQTVANANALLDNDFVIFKKDATLAKTAGTALIGGTNGATVTGDHHVSFLNAVESQSFHILCCPVLETSVKQLYVAFTKRMREEEGIKFQMVGYRMTDANHEGIISVENKADQLEQGLVYWVTGAQAACEINKTLENKSYTGELMVDANYTSRQLSDGILFGQFLFHRVPDGVKVLMDINTLTEVTLEKGADFSSNQTIRVLDEIGSAVASLFNNQYLGKVPNDESGRVSLWNDIVSYYQQLVTLRAIEEFDSKEVMVEAGESKRSITINSRVTPINCMSQLYMTVVVQ